jgi:hypothetical protein
MVRIGLVAVLFALAASASLAEETRSDVARTQVRLTEQLNARISRGVDTLDPAPPASIEDLSDDEAPAPPASRASS